MPCQDYGDISGDNDRELIESLKVRNDELSALLCSTIKAINKASKENVVLMTIDLTCSVWDWWQEHEKADEEAKQELIDRLEELRREKSAASTSFGLQIDRVEKKLEEFN